MPRTYPDYPHHTQIAAYFEAYVDHFGFRDRIRFETPVRHARRGPRGRGWVLETAAGETREYDALLVANGHHWDERWPEPAFPGARHARRSSSSTPTPTAPTRSCAARTSSWSAWATARWTSRWSPPTSPARRTCPARRGAWVTPKYLLGRPTDQLKNDPRVPFRIRRWMVEKLLLAQVGADGALRAAQARPPLRRGAPDGLRAHPGPHRARRGHARARTSRACTSARSSSPTGRACRATSSSTAPGTRSASRSSTRTSCPRPTTTSSSSAASSTPTTPTSPSSGCCSRSGRSCRCPRRRGSGSPTTCAGEYALPMAAAMREDIRRDQAAMRKRYVDLQAPHDPGRLRRLPARPGQGARGRRRAGAGRRVPRCPCPAARRAPRWARDRHGRARGQARADQGGQPRRDPRRRAPRLRRPRLRRGVGARHRAAHRPGRGHVLQLLPGQGVRPAGAARRGRHGGPRAACRRRAARRARPRRSSPTASAPTSPTWPTQPELFELMRRNAGTLRAMFDEPAIGAGRRGARGRPAGRGGRGPDPRARHRRSWRGRWSAPPSRSPSSCSTASPTDVDGAVAFVTGLFLGGLERLG